MWEPIQVVGKVLQIDALFLGMKCTHTPTHPLTQSMEPEPFLVGPIPFLAELEALGVESGLAERFQDGITVVPMKI